LKNTVGLKLRLKSKETNKPHKSFKGFISFVHIADNKKVKKEMNQM